MFFFFAFGNPETQQDTASGAETKQDDCSVDKMSTDSNEGASSSDKPPTQSKDTKNG